MFGKLPVPGRTTSFDNGRARTIMVGQEPSALTVDGSGWMFGCLFSLLSFLSSGRRPD